MEETDRSKHPGHASDSAQSDIRQDDLERMVALMLQALPTLDCPQCCDQGHRYQYVEMSAQMYRDEWEWACFSVAILEYRQQRQPRAGPGSAIDPA